MAALSANPLLASTDVAAAPSKTSVGLCPQQTSTEESLEKKALKMSSDLLELEAECIPFVSYSCSYA